MDRVHLLKNKKLHRLVSNIKKLICFFVLHKIDYFHE